MPELARMHWWSHVFMASAQHSAHKQGLSHFLTSLWRTFYFLSAFFFSAFSKRILECSSHVHTQSANPDLILITSDSEQKSISLKSLA